MQMTTARAAAYDFAGAFSEAAPDPLPDETLYLSEPWQKPG
jgi:hypothetical protein